MADRPNILIIWGDDIGQSNLSRYSDGLMGYRTPNIDRVASEGVRFTDYYGEQSCTAGRAACLEDVDFTWGDEARPDGRIMANNWDGPDFPWRSTRESGWVRTSPVATYPANGYGIFDMAGNVWEWTDDWWTSHRPDAAGSPCCAPANPRGGDLESSCDASQPQFRIGRKVIQGGSHLCADSYCLRYRPAARRPQMVDTGMSHVGFRCVRREGTTTSLEGSHD